MDIADDGRVFYTELVRGQIRVCDPRTQQRHHRAHASTSTPAARTACSASRSTPDFADQRPRSTSTTRPRAADDAAPANFKSRLSRASPSAAAPSTARPRRCCIEVPARRLPDEPGHTGGGLDFDAAGQPAPRRRRRRQPALRAVRWLRAAVRPATAPSTTPARPRPTPTTCAASCCASPRGRRLGYTIPDGNLFPEADGTDEDPARDLRDGLPQPVPVLGRPGDRRHQPGRLLARQRHRRARHPRPGRHLGVEPDHEPGQLRLAAVHGQQRAVPRRRLRRHVPTRSRWATSSTAPTRSTTPRATPA